MALAQFDFHLDCGADWQRTVRLRDPNGVLVQISAAVMEIRNVNGVLALRLDAASSRCTVLSDGASIQLHITGEESLTFFQWGNYPGAVQAVGYWGIGRAYVYDLFVEYVGGVTDRALRGFFQVDPNITRPVAASGPELPIPVRGG